MSSYCNGNKTYRAGLIVRSGSDIYFCRREKCSDDCIVRGDDFILMVTVQVTGFDYFFVTLIVTFPSLVDMLPRLDIAFVFLIVFAVSLGVR